MPPARNIAKENFIFFLETIAGGGFRLKHLQWAAAYSS
jgi:hypothetical protein